MLRMARPSIRQAGACAFTATAASVQPSGHTAGHIAYARADGKPRCIIEVQQSPERYDALLDMFKDGYVSEITVLIDGLADQPDYSKKWDTAAGDRLTVKAICFEFPLPQSEA